MTYLVSVIVSVLLTSAAFAQSPSLMEAREEMTAAVARQDRIAFARFLSDDLTSIDSAGKLRNKSAAVEEMPAGNTQSPAEVSAYGDGAVVAIGYGRTGESPARIIQAWWRTPDQWQMVAFQGVRAAGTVTPATLRSSSLPASSGMESERAAVQRTLEALQESARRGEAPSWAALVTDRFVATSPIGGFQRKADVMRDIAMGERKQVPPGIEETSVRIHGTLAVVNVRIRSRENDELWRTAILVKEANQWRQAAEITTPITGAARSAPQ